MTFRQATLEDFEFIRNLRNSQDMAEGFVVSGYITPAQQQAYMAQHGAHYYVAIKDGTPTGFIGVINRDLRLAVCKACQRQGIAAFMLQHIQQIYNDFDVCVKESNTASKNFFLKHGFVQNYITMRNGTRVIMMKKAIAQTPPQK